MRYVIMLITFTLSHIYCEVVKRVGSIVIECSYLYLELLKRRIIMGDTSRGFWPKENCSDCGEVGVVFLKHWGPLVPADAIGFFCVFC